MTQPNPATPGAPAAAPPATPPAPPAPVQPPAPVVTPPAPPAAPSTPAADPQKVEDLPPWAQKIISDTRTEAATHRAGKQAETDRVKAILAAAGIKTDDDDPVKALETTRATNETLEAQNRTLRVELALGGAARTHGADEALLAAVLAHKGELAKLDPAAADFAQTLDALVKATVEANPKLKGGQAPTASGVSAPGGPGDTADIDAQIDAAAKAGNHELAVSLRRRKAYTRPA